MVARDEPALAAQDTPLAYMYASMRTLRIADGACAAAAAHADRPCVCWYCYAVSRCAGAGPDEVHLKGVALLELSKYAKRSAKL